MSGHGDPPRALRADARRNRDHLLEVAAVVVAEQGAQASLRDIARRAEVGMGTLYRHFPTREALLEALLGAHFDGLAVSAADLEGEHPPDTALRAWLALFLEGSATHRGLTALLMAALEDKESPLGRSCLGMREAGARLLRAAQRDGTVRADVDGIDVFALVWDGLAARS